MGIGDRLLVARKAKRYSMRELAEIIGLSPMAISKYERDISMPSSKVLMELSKALDVSIEYFFRPMKVGVDLQAFRKHTTLLKKELESIQASIQDWIERYLEVEQLFPSEVLSVSYPPIKINSLQDAENLAYSLREEWNLGIDPIENFTQLLEDKGFLVGLVSGYDHFDACTFRVNERLVIVSKNGLPGDRQRFNIGHELGHLLMDVNQYVDPEKAANVFVGSFLIPAESARYELGEKRSDLSFRELLLLKQKYGVSMQAWIYRASELEIITSSRARELFKQIRMNGWYKEEPGIPFPAEEPMRMEKLIYRALAEEIISRSRAQELLGKPLQLYWNIEALKGNDASIVIGD